MYILVKEEGIRLLMVPAKELDRWKFYVRGEEGRVPVQFLPADKMGAKFVKWIPTEVIVMRKANPSHFHYEFMRNSRLILNGWGGVSHDELVENMMEPVETV